MNMYMMISIIGVLVLGWYLLRRNTMLGALVLGVGIVSAVSVFDLTGFVTSIPPALASGIDAVLSSVNA